MNIELKPCPFCGGTTSLEIEKSNYPDEKHVVCNFNTGGCGGNSCYADGDVAAIQKWNRREAQRWIPVSEGLPDPAQEVLINTGHYVCSGTLDISVNGENFFINDCDDGTEVTHWMPLPAAPKEISNEHAI